MWKFQTGEKEYTYSFWSWRITENQSDGRITEVNCIVHNFSQRLKHLLNILVFIYVGITQNVIQYNQIHPT